MTVKWPYDYDRLGKGDLITNEQIAIRTGVPIGTTPEERERFELARLGERSKIERELWRRGKHITIKGVREGLRLLHDPEAAEHNARMFESARRQLGRYYYRNSGVDESKLSDEQRAIHRRHLLVEGKVVQAVTDARRAALTAHKRKTPRALDD